MGGELPGPDKVFGEAGPPSNAELEDVAIEVRPLVERYVAKRVRNPDHQEEIVSRVFEALARSWSNFRHDCPASAFVVRIAANAIKNYYERDLAKFSRQISLDVWCEEFCLQQNASVTGPDQEVHMRDEVQSLLGEMQKACSEVECAVVGLLYQGYTMDEISTLLGLQASTVRSHVLRGRERLLAHLLIEAPDLLGGAEAVEAAVRRLETGTGATLSKDEAEAVRSRKGPVTLLRKAMLKLAPYLGTVIAMGSWVFLFLRGGR